MNKRQKNYKVTVIANLLGVSHTLSIPEDDYEDWAEGIFTPLQAKFTMQYDETHTGGRTTFYSNDGRLVYTFEVLK